MSWCKEKKLVKYIRDNTKCKVVGRDVHNLVARLKAREAGDNTVAKRLHKWMKEFSEEPGNIGRIFVSTENEQEIATCVTLQTSVMREMF
ncbi:hypothetical protein V7S43_007519 [Phytophthora oleae]|uniref:RXLR phytopathogen effector protein WY-domain domain-containing protein n=1 Tax=Phytophthora oleae TaxID=2107226 RepID=A0ABD3FLK5_9STRA